MTISTRLDEAMSDAKFSQSALARASGVPQPTINRILKGPNKRGPETETIRKLAQACNVAFDWLNEGVGPKSRTAGGKAAEAVVLPVTRPAPESWLERVDAVEADLLEMYRGLSKAKQDAVLAQIRIFAKGSEHKASVDRLNQAEGGTQRK